MTTHQTIEELVNQKFDPISKKVNDIELLHICSKLERYTFIDVPSKLVNYYEGETILKVFLGGTCNNSAWRNELIKMLEINYFNPVVDDWTSECMLEELKQREESDFCLYVITPEMTGVYSIAEVVDDSNKQPQKTIFCPLEKYGEKEFTKSQFKSLDQVGKMVERNGGLYLHSLTNVAFFLNKMNKD